jgi:uncharacterized protein (DUF2141 family)
MVVAAMMLLAGPLRAQQEDTPRLTANAPGKTLCALQIHATGFRNDQGRAGGTVFASSDGWSEATAKAVVHGGFPIANHEATEVFQVPAGKYGVAVIHDENSNHKLDRNFLGIPKEGFGFANNPKVLLTAPSFETATVQVSCPLTRIEVRLIYK